MCVNLSVIAAIASGTAVLVSVSTFLRVRVAEPVVPGRIELATVDPKISKRARIGAEFAQFARAFTSAARWSLLIRSTQSLHVIASV